MSERRAIAATLLLSGYFTAAELLGDEFAAILSPTQWASAIDPAANWAIDRYFQQRLNGIDEELIAGNLWIDEIEPRARRLFAEGGVVSVESFYLAGLVAILDDYWKLASELVVDEQAPALAQLRNLSSYALGNTSPLSPMVRGAAEELARAWHSMVERLS